MKQTHFKKSAMKKEASALMLSFFLMSILILVGMSVSILVIRDLATVRTIVGGTQAYYAAEGVTEMGLYDLKENLPGFEPTYDFSFLNAAVGTLASVARSNTLYVPCEGQGDEWHELGQNESVQIPLFAQTDAAGSIEPSDGAYMNFYVEFYVGEEEGGVNEAAVPTSDVLRWKVLGRAGSSSAPGATEAMSEYIPLYNDLGYYNSTSPTRFGTADLGGLPPGYQDGKFYSSSGASFDAGYPISTFLSGHVFNYLVLTNILTESTSNDTIFYRFRSMDYEPVCEYVELAATGSSEYGSAQQSLDTFVKEGENLPVFDFVIYHTDPTEAGPVVTGPTIPDWVIPLTLP